MKESDFIHVFKMLPVKSKVGDKIVGNKKKYVTYAPYHEEYLLYPCIFRGSDYTCNNCDAPRYGRICKTKYPCKHDQNDPSWFNKYQMFKQSQEESRNEQKQGHLQDEADKCAPFPTNNPQKTITYECIRDWPNMPAFKNKLILDGYKERIHRVAIDLQKWSKTSILDEAEYTRRKKNAIRSLQQVVDYVNISVLPRNDDGRKLLGSPWTKRVVQNRDVEAYLVHCRQFSDSEVERQTNYLVAAFLKGKHLNSRPRQSKKKKEV